MKVVLTLTYLPLFIYCFVIKPANKKHKQLFICFHVNCLRADWCVDRLLLAEQPTDRLVCAQLLHTSVELPHNYRRVNYIFSCYSMNTFWVEMLHIIKYLLIGILFLYALL